MYAAGYLIALLMPEVQMYLTLHPGLIMRGQVWRLVSWLLIPPGNLSIFTIIMLYFYFSLGRSLEYTWGAFRSLRDRLYDHRSFPAVFCRRQIRLFQYVLY